MKAKNYKLICGTADQVRFGRKYGTFTFNSEDRPIQISDCYPSDTKFREQLKARAEKFLGKDCRWEPCGTIEWIPA